MESQIANSLSIAIVCYHTPKEELQALIKSLIVCLNKLLESNSFSSAIIYLVDNSETTTSLLIEDLHQFKNALESLKTEVRLIHGQGNVGYGAAHNLALEKSNSAFHLILNPDVVLDENCLVTGIEYLLANDKTIMVSPSAEDSAGKKQYLCKRYPSVLTFIVRGFFPGFMKKIFKQRLASFEMHELSELSPGIDIPIVSGCFMLCKTRALKELNGFDDNFFMYFEDFDLSMRAAGIGRLDYLPSMKIVHDGGNAAKKGLSHLLMFAKSGIRFFNLHGWRLFKQ